MMHAHDDDGAMGGDDNYCARCRQSTAPSDLALHEGAWLCPRCLARAEAKVLLVGGDVPPDDDTCEVCGAAGASFLDDVEGGGRGLLCVNCALDGVKK